MTTLKGADPYAEAERRLDILFTDVAPRDPAELYRDVCAILNETIPTYSWVGIYLVEGADLVLAAWQGPEATEHVRIPVGAGICGAAAASGETIVVDDVNADPRYLACFINMRAEIVVPIVSDGVVRGEIDIDSDHRGAFGPADRALLEALAARIASATVRDRGDAAGGYSRG